MGGKDIDSLSCVCFGGAKPLRVGASIAVRPAIPSVLCAAMDAACAALQRPHRESTFRDRILGMRSRGSVVTLASAVIIKQHCGPIVAQDAGQGPWQRSRTTLHEL
jgi:hypothetical protein